MSGDAAAPSPRAVLRVDALARHFGGLRAVDGVSFDVMPGSIMGIIGPNGAGKSTLFNLIAGEQAPTSGRILLGESDVTKVAGYRRARLGLGRTFQTPRPIARLSVLENMLLAGRDQPGERLWTPLIDPHRVEARENDLRAQALDALRFFEIDSLSSEYAGALSAGQKKLLDLARALMMDPHVLLLDEPMAGVNPTLARKLMDKIDRLRHERGITFLLIEHDLETVLSRCDPILVMANGKLIAKGSAGEIRRDRGVVDAYLGGTG